MEWYKDDGREGRKRLNKVFYCVDYDDIMKECVVMSSDRSEWNVALTRFG